MQNRPDLIRGAMHLAGASMIVKVIGACFKIPLGAVLGPEGTAIFSVAYNLYAFLLVLATAGVPAAVSKLVAQFAAKGKPGEISRVVKTARLCFGCVGLLGSLLLLFGAEWFSCALGAPSAENAIRAISPAVFLVSVLSVNRGYYQGFGNMLPTAMSEVIEAAGKLVLGLSLAWWLRETGSPLSVQAAGAIGGVSLGCVLSCLYFKFVPHGVSMAMSREIGKLGLWSTFKHLLSQVIPITAAASVIGLVGVIDSAVIMKTLQSVGISQSRAMWMFGTYTYAANLFNLPNALVTALAVSLIPVVATNTVEQKQELLRKTEGRSLELGLLIALTGAAGLGVLSHPILSLLYGSGVEASAIRLAGDLLVILCFGIPPLALVTVTNAIHQATGRVGLPVLSMLLGAAVKLASNRILLRIPEFHILGAAFSTVLCYTVIAGVNWIFLKERPASLLRICRKPLFVAFCTGFFAKLTFMCMNVAFSEKIAVVLSVLTGGITFFWLASLVKISLFPKKYAEKSEKLE